jgi:hypothetical protein
MAEIFRKGIHKEFEKKIRKKSKKKAPPANSLRELAGGWARKEAKDFMDAIRSSEEMVKTI